MRRREWVSVLSIFYPAGTLRYRSRRHSPFTTANEPNSPCMEACGLLLVYDGPSRLSLFTRREDMVWECCSWRVDWFRRRLRVGDGARVGPGSCIVEGDRWRREWTVPVNAVHVPSRGIRPAVYEVTNQTSYYHHGNPSVSPRVFYLLGTLAHRWSIRATFELPTTTHHSPPGLQPTCRPTKLDVFEPNASTL